MGVYPAGRRYRPGSRIPVPKQVRSVRDIVRRHLREEAKTYHDLAPAMGYKYDTVRRLMYDGSPMRPDQVEAIIKALGLDEFDSQELRLQGAIEAGWALNFSYSVNSHVKVQSLPAQPAFREHAAREGDVAIA